ncbi:MAG: dihydroorotate dehydrogenase electron transfer subunit [Candidatus Hydrogenedentes bacterium]|nr:dihydroorotate dehydrogenase electron transfer subunit [Candidatus Hydrogenedentota bacterium]
MPHIVNCEVLTHRELAPGQFRVALQGPAIASEAKAGQFGMIEVARGYYPFLRRPMCFERILADAFTVLYKLEGEGTRLLSAFLPGQMISVQGPLGNGFPIESNLTRHIIVAGGIGVATFPGLAEALIKVCDTAPEVVLAARTKDLLLCEQDFREMGCKVHLATDDGSAGEKAYASQVLERLSPAPGTRVYACGPMIMMRETSRVALEAGAECLVSLEAQMACGDGVCLGCVVESKHESEGERMIRVCCDGPVFDARMVDWEAHNFAYDP